MPNQPRTPTSSYRLPVRLKEALRRYAWARGESETAVVIRAVEDYLERQGIRLEDG